MGEGHKKCSKVGAGQKKQSEGSLQVAPERRNESKKGKAGKQTAATSEKKKRRCAMNAKHTRGEEEAQERGEGKRGKKDGRTKGTGTKELFPRQKRGGKGESKGG